MSWSGTPEDSPRDPTRDTAAMDYDDARNEARELRRTVIDMAYAAGSGHCGGSLSCVEILLTLFRHVLRVRPDEPDWDGRDRFILSKGHAAPALYALLARWGFFPAETRFRPFSDARLTDIESTA